ncbi:MULTISPECIES: class II aldolase/adducin family protein [unclassified Cobetia]|uniref:class II aldolase/adducin family protein n=1 Tax=unclassified Cobetia TaxID=2609414 RepID=UPI00159DD4D8|nr:MULTISPECIES: class II aldolase/adducin family protein [unclassified Cobetia]MCO7231720.1 class II aldolase/adducin family protein [Cobetia sp. Dlab-2-AX]MCO7234964.1 class II aldolase/adducin family protein [Cobetia sp. Dlab-2-U]NVN55528.1 class II aldolase/adducin family protein [bacterium Scap17]
MPKPAIEETLRVDLAAAYRLLERNGWSDQVFTHISVRLPGETPAFLINAYGLLPEEITASNLVTIGIDGQKLNIDDPEVNPAGFTIHSAIHMHRHDAVCVMHTHTLAGMAVAALEEGLLPLNQTNMAFYNRVAYYNYEGIPLDLEVRNRIVAALGDRQCAILRNHGLLTTGRSVAEAYFNMFYLNKACEIQLEAMKAGRPLIMPSAQECEYTAQQFENPRYHAESVDLTWAAELRRLDREAPDFRH